MSKFIERWIFSSDFRKNIISNLIEIRPVAEFFHADRQTDGHETIVGFRNLGNAPNICLQNEKVGFGVCSELRQVSGNGFGLRSVFQKRNYRHNCPVSLCLWTV
jgi:hypothetical protein